MRMKHNVLTEYRNILKESKSIAEQIKLLEIREGDTRALEHKYWCMRNDLLIRQAHIEDMIKQLEPIERMLIRYRFFEGLKWEQVFIKLSYSQKQTFRLYSRILKKLNKLER